MNWLITFVLLSAASVRADVFASGTLVSGYMGGPPSTNLPSFALQPQNISVPAEQAATFSATAIGGSPLSYQWLTNGVAQGGATAATLVVTNCDVPQRGNYSVVVTNLYGAATSSVAILSVTLDTNILYVDSVAGSDTNTGTTNFPIASLGKSRTVDMAGKTNYWKRGSLFYESYEIPNNITIDAYGTGPKPIMDGTTNLANANFSKTAGATFVYQYPLRVPVESNKWINIVHSNVLMVLQNGVRLGGFWSGNAGFGSISNVDTNTGSFWYDNTNAVLYVHPRTNDNPITDGATYGACIRTLNLHGGSGFTVNNVEARDAYMFNALGNQGYQALGNLGGTYRHCRFHGGWNHVAGVANSVYWTKLTFDSCTIYDGDPFSGPVLCISYNDGFAFGTNSAPPYPLVVWTNCLVYQPGWVNPAGSVGFYGHGGGVAYETLNCVCTNLGSAFSGGGDATIPSGEFLDANALVINCGQALASIPIGQTMSNFTVFYSGVFGPISGGQTSGSFINSKFVDKGGANLFQLALCTNAYTLALTNCIFGSTNSTGIAFNLAGGITLYSVSNTFNGIRQVYQADSRSATNYIIYSDNNDVWNLNAAGGVGYNIPSGYATLAAWINAYPQFDAHSTTNNPGYTATTFAPPTVTDPSGP